MEWTISVYDRMPQRSPKELRTAALDALGGVPGSSGWTIDARDVESRRRYPSWDDLSIDMFKHRASRDCPWRDADVVNALAALAEHMSPSRILVLEDSYAEHAPVPTCLYVADTESLCSELQRLAFDTSNYPLWEGAPREWIWKGAPIMAAMSPELVAEGLAMCPDKVRLADGYFVFNRSEAGTPEVMMCFESLYESLLAVARGERPALTGPSEPEPIPRYEPHALEIRVSGADASETWRVAERLGEELLFDYEVVDVDGVVVIRLGFMGFAQLSVGFPDPTSMEVELLALLEDLARLPSVTEAEVIRGESATAIWRRSDAAMPASGARTRLGDGVLWTEDPAGSTLPSRFTGRR